MTETLGWQFVVDNRAGAGGTIGIEAAVRAAADGYTIVMGQTSNLAINPALHKKLPYDSLQDLAPVTLVSSIPIAVMVAAKAPYSSFGDLVKAAKAKPDQLVFASPGNGSVAHLAGELLQSTAGIKYIHVPYKGAIQAFPDLLGGRANFFLASLETAMPQVTAGTIRVLAVTSAVRSPSLPAVPTVAESGYKGFESSSWYGVLVPNGTPEPIITRLSAEIERVLQMPDLRHRMVDGGGGVKTGPREFAALLKADHAKWARVVKESGAKVD